MLNLIRELCTIVIVETSSMNELMDELEINFGTNRKVRFSNDNLYGLLSDAQKDEIVVLLTQKMGDEVKQIDVEYMMLIPTNLERFSSRLMNKPIAKSFITEIRFLPKLIVMRVAGNMDATINKISEDIEGTIENTVGAIEKISNGTVVFITDSALHRSIDVNDIFEKCVRTSKSFSSIMDYLNAQDFRYLTVGNSKYEWTELTIKIYDSYGRYDLHYNRLHFVFEKLEIGMIIGEAWGTDSASIFQSVDVYQVRFFTFKSPTEIKRILVGLEYLHNAERICDYDLFYKRKKIHWDKVRIDNVKGKVELGVYWRSKLIENFSENEKIVFIELENEIAQSKLK
ncbi:hypothetical protein EZV73_14985 [Acidaminobacter sp. JC074]|uniref:hypothetical protein n=1 Tax=Acidaminobacter sp. JC074 TaxID=2530199 RepID=UPI001F0D3506|nr:hypothetical protein [Acidaminobacter sp. JC074]MCH4888899.1 hypothetical protein [Acidaminobacter sp. JC074]